MLTKGQWKFIGLLVPMLIVFYTAGIFIVTQLPDGMWWDVLGGFIPLVFGFVGVWFTHCIGKRNRWL